MEIFWKNFEEIIKTRLKNFQKIVQKSLKILGQDSETLRNLKRKKMEIIF